MMSAVEEVEEEATLTTLDKPECRRIHHKEWDYEAAQLVKTESD